MLACVLCNDSVPTRTGSPELTTVGVGVSVDVHFNGYLTPAAVMWLGDIRQGGAGCGEFLLLCVHTHMLMHVAQVGVINGGVIGEVQVYTECVFAILCTHTCTPSKCTKQCQNISF